MADLSAGMRAPSWVRVTEHLMRRHKPILEFSDDEYELLLDCIHCGFCLSTCPTFVQLSDEVDSPRGRIYLMRALTDGRVDTTPTVLSHFERCLGCRACQTACPSGVRYGFLLEMARAQLEAQRKGLTKRDPMIAFLARYVFPYPKRFGWMMNLVRIARKWGFVELVRGSKLLCALAGKWLAMEEMLPPLSNASARCDLPEVTAPDGKPIARVGILTGCVASVLFSHVNRATVNVLSHLGCEVIVPAEQGCCGALAMHVGFRSDAKKFAKRNIEVFERYELDYIIVNAAGCASAMKEYGEWFADEPAWEERAQQFATKVRDFTEFVAELPFREKMHPVKMRVTYDDPCHLLHAQGIYAQPRALIKAIPGIEYIELTEADMCCGSAGIYNIVCSELSMRDRKS
ncbi:MAG TPA: 4Fe-4S dicluster domain-containing protein, partial [Armatimonadetes bacterium]|nr:4Fe-4S dicluster domain-containing protein [Armatimonadota bacterium]